MNLLQRWFIGLFPGVERFLWGAVLLALALTVSAQAVLNFQIGRRLLNPVESLEGVPWPPDPDGNRRTAR